MRATVSVQNLSGPDQRLIGKDFTSVTDRGDRNADLSWPIRFCSSAGRMLVPVEHTQRSQGVPPAGPTVAILDREMHLPGMSAFQ